MITIENTTYERFTQFGEHGDSEDEILNKILDIADASLKTLDLE
jgi:hypothetical protein